VAASIELGMARSTANPMTLAIRISQVFMMSPWGKGVSLQSFLHR
jgi:hypothetical protein